MDENATAPAFPPITDTLPPNDQPSDVVGSGSEDRVSEPPERVSMTARPMPPDPGTGEIFLDLSAAAAELLADVAWAHEQINVGNWDVYSGEYVAVQGKRVLGHDVAPQQLRQQTAAASGVDPRRIVIKYVDLSFEC